ncbi:MAG TPA: TonB C-terminal domain-containing protein [Blastocatellia bacterium]|nr:TonB C-terminal domain-containing protein [Blastocatellia bacterium]
MFESIEELTNIDYAAERKRLAIGGVVAVACWTIVSILCVIASMFKPVLGEPVSYDRKGSGELVELTRVAPLPPTPRTLRESSSHPAGNAMVEREIVTSNARVDADRRDEQAPNKPGQPPPPGINMTNVPAPGPNSGGPAVITSSAEIPSAPPPPPPPQKEEQPAQSDTGLVNDVRSRIRHSSMTDPSATGSSGQKGMRLDGGAGVDLGSNKALLEKRMWTAWQKTKSEYTDMQRAGRAVVVYFDWYRDGHLVFTGFGTRTGNAALDNEARNAVQNASPFYPIPKEITLNVIHLNATFTY